MLVWVAQVFNLDPHLLHTTHMASVYSNRNTVIFWPPPPAQAPLPLPTKALKLHQHDVLHGRLFQWAYQIYSFATHKNRLKIRPLRRIHHLLHPLVGAWLACPVPGLIQHGSQCFGFPPLLEAPRHTAKCIPAPPPTISEIFPQGHGRRCIKFGIFFVRFGHGLTYQAVCACPPQTPSHVSSATLASNCTAAWCMFAALSFWRHGHHPLD